MKKLMALILLAGLFSTVQANSNKNAVVAYGSCNYWINYPCPGNPINVGCFATYDEAQAYLNAHPMMLCP